MKVIGSNLMTQMSIGLFPWEFIKKNVANKEWFGYKKMNPTFGASDFNSFQNNKNAYILFYLR